MTLGSFYLIETGNITSTFHTGDDRQMVVIPCLALTGKAAPESLQFNVFTPVPGAAQLLALQF